MIINFSDLFEFAKEKDSKNIPNLTEERIYSFSDKLSNYSKVPVFSGSTLNKGVIGYVPNFIKEQKNNQLFSTTNHINYYNNYNESITIVADGNAGHMFYRNKMEFPVFCMNISCIALFNRKIIEIKKRYSDFDGLDLKWFFLKYRNYILNQVKGEGVQHFTKKIYKNIYIEVPKLEIQKKEKKVLKKAYELEDKLNKLNKMLTKLSHKYLVMPKDVVGDVHIINYFLKHTSRNDVLSKEGLYLRSKDLDKFKEKITVASGSNDWFYGYTPKKKDLHYIANKPCLHVITRGQAGKIHFFKQGTYATNTNAMLLTLKDEKLAELNITSEEEQKEYLKFLKFYLEPFFRKCVSQADLSVLPLTEIISKETLFFPKMDNNIKESVKVFDKLTNALETTKILKKELSNLTSKECLSS
ncbi:MAG: restriction endonuclease subunit S [Candidatus Micrarchaeota archaeon]